jgi:uncharacterized membrane protein
MCTKKIFTTATLCLAMLLAAWTLSSGTAAAQPTGETTTHSDPDAATVDDYWTRTLPLHPKAVHIPIALCILLPAVIMGVIVARKLGWLDASAWLLVAGLQFGLFASSIIALQSGKDDGAKVEGYASEVALDTHRNRAYTFVYVAAAQMLCGAAVFVMRRRKSEMIFGIVSLAMASGSAYAGYKVGDAGGRLVYVANGSDAHKQ